VVGGNLFLPPFQLSGPSAVARFPFWRVFLEVLSPRDPFPDPFLGLPPSDFLRPVGLIAPRASTRLEYYDTPCQVRARPSDYLRERVPVPVAPRCQYFSLDVRKSMGCKLESKLFFECKAGNFPFSIGGAVPLKGLGPHPALLCFLFCEALIVPIRQNPPLPDSLVAFVATSRHVLGARSPSKIHIHSFPRFSFPHTHGDPFFWCPGGAYGRLSLPQPERSLPSAAWDRLDSWAVGLAPRRSFGPLSLASAYSFLGGFPPLRESDDHPRHPASWFLTVELVFRFSFNRGLEFRCRESEGGRIRTFRAGSSRALRSCTFFPCFFSLVILLRSLLLLPSLWECLEVGCFPGPPRRGEAHGVESCPVDGVPFGSRPFF